jgi:short-chain fatty acids transporter
VRTVQSFGITFEKPAEEKETLSRPGEWLEQSPLLTILAALILTTYIIYHFRTSPQGTLAALDLSTYNLIFIVLAMVLHWRPRCFLRAVADAVPATGGVLIQFPFYAAIFGIITGTKISGWLAHIFVSVTTQTSYPLLVAFYSAILGVFIPSGGSKWIIEAPYLLKAATAHQVHLGWVVQIYNASEALPNLVNPFWMLPMLGLLKVKAKDLVGYAIVQLLIQAPIVFFLCWLFARTLQWVPPSP